MFPSVIALLALAAPECDWSFSKRTPAAPIQVIQQVQQVPTPAAPRVYAQPQAAPPAVYYPPAIAEGRIPPVGYVVPAGVSSCGNPLCPCGACDCRNCCCGMGREALQQRARLYGIAESATAPAATPVRVVPAPVVPVVPVPVAPVRVVPLTYTSPASQWTWPGGTEASLRQHLQAHHRISTAGMTYAQCVAAHNALHNGTSQRVAYQPPRVTLPVAKACPG